MHIQTTKPELLTAVTQAASAAGKEDWNGMHISIEGNQQVRFRATNLETYVRTTLTATNNDAGQVVVPAPLLVKAIKNITDDTISIRTQNRKLVVHGSNGSARYRLPILDIDSVPQPPDAGEPAVARLATETLHRLITQTAGICVSDTGRPHLTGVLWEIDGISITCVSTDSTRLAVAMTDDNETHGSKTLLIPGKKLLRITKLLSADSTEVYASDRAVLFRSGSVEAWVRLLDSQYPNWQAVLAHDIELIVHVDRDEALALMQRSDIAGKSKPIQLSVTPDTLSVRTYQPTDDIAEFDGAIQCDANGSGEQTYTPKVVIEGLQACPSGMVSIHVETESAQSLITTEGFKYMMMPVSTY